MMHLEKKYTGKTAADYESKRSTSWKWEFENKAVLDFLRQIEQKTVLDSPVGTGRFVPIYQQLGMEVTGLDISEDMLRQARAKGAEHSVLGDLFQFKSPTLFDVVVCVRFLNWLTPPQMAAAICKLNSLTKRYVIVSLTTSDGPAIRKSSGAFIPSCSQLSLLLQGFNIRGQRAHKKSGQTARIILLEKS